MKERGWREERKVEERERIHLCLLKGGDFKLHTLRLLCEGSA